MTEKAVSSELVGTEQGDRTTIRHLNRPIKYFRAAYILVLSGSGE